MRARSRIVSPLFLSCLQIRHVEFDQELKVRINKVYDKKLSAVKFTAQFHLSCNAVLRKND